MNLKVKDENEKQSTKDFLYGGLPSYKEQLGKDLIRTPSTKVTGGLKENLKQTGSKSGFHIVGNQPDDSSETSQESQSTASSSSYLPSFDEQCKEIMRRHQNKFVRTDSMRKVGKLADKLKAFETKDQRASNERASAPVSRLQPKFDTIRTNHRWSASLSQLELSNKIKAFKNEEQISSNIQAPSRARNSLLVRTPSMKLAGSIKDKIKVFGMDSKTSGSADENQPKQQIRQPINQNNAIAAHKAMVQIRGGEAIEEIYCGTKYTVHMGRRHSCTGISRQREGIQHRSMPQAGKVSDKVKAFQSKEQLALRDITKNSDDDKSFHYKREILVVASPDDNNEMEE